MKLPEAVANYVAYKQSLGMRFVTEARTVAMTTHCCCFFTTRAHGPVKQRN